MCDGFPTRFWPKWRYNGRVMAREVSFYQCLWVTKLCAKFGCSQTPRTASAHKSFIVLRCMWKEPAPFNSAPASQNVSMFRKIDRKKSKPCVVHGKLIKRVHLFKCWIRPFFLPGSKNSLGLLWRPADYQLAPWLLWSWPPVWAPPGWSPSISSFFVFWRWFVCRENIKRLPGHGQWTIAVDLNVWMATSRWSLSLILGSFIFTRLTWLEPSLAGPQSFGCFVPLAMFRCAEPQPPPLFPPIIQTFPRLPHIWSPIFPHQTKSHTNPVPRTNIPCRDKELFSAQ